MAGNAHFITGHEQTQFNRVCSFRFLDTVLASKGSDYSELCYIKTNIYTSFAYHQIERKIWLKVVHGANQVRQRDESGSEVIIFFMLKSAEHEILKFKMLINIKISRNSFFRLRLA